MRPGSAAAPPPAPPAAALHDVNALAAWLRQHAFGFPVQPAGPRRLGAEVELIPVRADTGNMAPLEAHGDGGAAILPFLRSYGARQGWIERPSDKGVPHFELPDGGALNLEPGGQLEYASSPLASAGALLDALDAFLPDLVAAADDRGLDLLAQGIDPQTPLAVAPLQLTARRYAVMDAYLARLGPSGARMMRQTAAVQVNVDPGAEPLKAWRLLNAAAPVFTAMCANSAVYEGRATGHRSFRAHCWRTLDPARTGMLEGRDPPREYAAMALDAPALFLGSPDEGYPSFREHALAGRAAPADLAVHLSTLFPEVRARGFLEVRSMDVVPLERLPAAVLLVVGLLADADSVAAGLEVVGAPDEGLLVAAGREGLAAPGLAARAAQLIEVALAGAGRLQREGHLSPARLDAARADLSHGACYAAPAPLPRLRSCSG